jgi:hypothetical protein
MIVSQCFYCFLEFRSCCTHPVHDIFQLLCVLVNEMLKIQVQTRQFLSRALGWILAHILGVLGCPAGCIAKDSEHHLFWVVDVAGLW